MASEEHLEEQWLQQQDYKDEDKQEGEQPSNLLPVPAVEFQTKDLLKWMEMVPAFSLPSSKYLTSEAELDCSRWLSLGVGEEAPPPPPPKATRKRSRSPADPHDFDNLPKRGCLGSSSSDQRPDPRSTREHLFTKVLTRSDTSKLNRLLVSKKDAERCFPLVMAGNGEPSASPSAARTRGSSSGEDGNRFVILAFEDESGRTWKFKYTHWCSSQGNVFTTGWISYVNHNGLRHGDEVSFFRDSYTNKYYLTFRKKNHKA
ncbi:putative AP2/ERF and B3 domain-containing protein Os01g0140700 [Selaginella moellendorffii]|uniref:putative AP2/ERF and B3 domain-containing protein Os01g0140700 n=1 Tax=Selaginella moellendorffii TaxID=88036 RepID=UPI000D1CF9F2|nr:putative AP2/ERF and B3 domain-containing protein Os01g0140700 [Selaginella moellendorffii]|eukprot:XP_024532320.1 putative AP2/ERF and B3 domain-containing protein Os01g0140700 [Selaginella moellendorffii]